MNQLKLTSTFEQVDAWYKSEITNAAWVYKNGNEVIALITSM